MTVQSPTATPARDLAVGLWTKEGFDADRRSVNKSTLIQVLVGWGLMLGLVLLFAGQSVPWYASLLGLLGFYLGVLKWMFTDRTSRSNLLKDASKQADWYRDVTCPNCSKPTSVSIGFLDFTCDSCGNWTYQRAQLPIRALGSGKQINKPISPEDLITGGTVCPSCRKPIALKQRAAKFFCPNCQTEARLPQIPI